MPHVYTAVCVLLALLTALPTSSRVLFSEKRNPGGGPSRHPEDSQRSIRASFSLFLRKGLKQVLSPSQINSRLLTASGVQEGLRGCFRPVSPGREEENVRKDGLSDPARLRRNGGKHPFWPVDLTIFSIVVLFS